MSTLGTESKEGSSKAGDAISTVLNLIPTLYYDLIARVCPGLALLCALLLASGRQTEAREFLRSGTAPELVFLLLLGYVAGISLTGVSALWDLSAIWLLDRLDALPAMGNKCFPEMKVIDKVKVFVQRADYVSLTSEAAGRTLGKMYAEVALAQNLLTGILVVMLFLLANDGWQSFDRAGMRYAIAIAVLLFLSMLYRQAAFLSRLDALQEIHHPRPKGSP